MRHSLINPDLFQLNSMFEKGIKTAYYSYCNEFTPQDIVIMHQWGYKVFSYMPEDESYPFRIITVNQQVYDELESSGFFKLLVMRYDDPDTNDRVNAWLGQVLGYPPKCTHRFTYTSFEIYNGTPNISIDYGGLQFRSFEDTWVDDIEWLLKTKPCMTNLKFTVIYYVDERDSSKDIAMSTTFVTSPGITSQLLTNIISEKFNLDIEKGRSYSYDKVNNGISV